MNRFYIALLLLLGACVPAKSATQARADARAALTATESAWMLVAKTCTDAAAASDDEALLVKCAAVLDPARADFIVADGVVNAWTDATSDAPLACKLVEDLQDISAGAVIVGISPSAITDASVVVNALVAGMGGCGDAGTATKAEGQ